MEPNITNPDLPVTGNPRIDHWLALIGALVPLMSALAGHLNNKVRLAQAAGVETDATLLKAAQIVNLLAVNFDKAKQLGALAKGLPTPTTTRGVVNAPAAPAVPAEPAATPEAKKE